LTGATSGASHWGLLRRDLLGDSFALEFSRAQFVKGHTKRAVAQQTDTWRENEKREPVHSIFKQLQTFAFPILATWIKAWYAYLKSREKL
jgi:hypothetical protein